jgi:hypothetical protein
LVYAELNLIEVPAIGNGCDSDILFCLKTEATPAKSICHWLERRIAANKKMKKE